MGNDGMEDLCIISPHSGNIAKWIGGKSCATREIALEMGEICAMCQVSTEMAHDLHVSRKCYEISRTLGNLIDLLFFCNKTCFCCEYERRLV